MYHLRPGLATLAVAALVIAGCSSGTTPQPTLEPRDEVVAALQSTAELQTVHALIRIELRDSNGQDYLVTIEGDVDVAARELDVNAMIDPETLGIREAQLVVVDGSVYSRLGNESWSVSGGTGQDPLESVPTTARIAAAVEEALRDPATTIRLEGAEDCGDARCDRIRAEVPAEVAWRAVNRMVQPVDQPAASLQPLPSGFPGFAIDLWIEQGTHRLRQATNTTVVDGNRLSIIVALSAHDAPVTIRPPVQPSPNG